VALLADDSAACGEPLAARLGPVRFWSAPLQQSAAVTLDEATPIREPYSPQLRHLRAWLRRQHAVPFGLVGSSAVACGGLFIGRLADTPAAQPLVALQSTGSARALGFGLAVGGLIVLTVAWLALGEQVRGAGDGRRRVLLAAALWAGPLLLTPPMFSDDVWSYVAEGDLVATDRSPYVYTPQDLSGPIVHAVNASWVDVHTPYGPLPLLWGGAVSHLSKDPWVDLYGFRALAVIGLLMIAWCAPIIAGYAGSDKVSATWLAVASPFTLAHGAAGAHLDVFMAGLMCWALTRALRGRWVSAAVLVGAAASVKAPAMVAAVAVVLASLPHGAQPARARARRTLEVLGLAAGTLFGVGAASGLGAGWVAGLTTPLSHRSTLSPSTEVGVVLSTLTGAHVVTPLHVVGTLLLLVLVVHILAAGPTGPSPSVMAAAATVMSATVLLSPVVHYWYFLWCLPFLACSALPPRPAGLALRMTLVLGLLAPVDQSHHIPLASTIMLVGVGGTLLTAIRPRHDVRRLSLRWRREVRQPSGPRPQRTSAALPPRTRSAGKPSTGKGFPMRRR
jgi:hypothetical protein